MLYVFATVKTLKKMSKKECWHILNNTQTDRWARCIWTDSHCPWSLGTNTGCRLELLAGVSLNETGICMGEWWAGGTTRNCLRQEMLGAARRCLYLPHNALPESHLHCWSWCPDLTIMQNIFKVFPRTSCLNIRNRREFYLRPTNELQNDESQLGYHGIVWTMPSSPQAFSRHSKTDAQCWLSGQSFSVKPIPLGARTKKRQFQPVTWCWANNSTSPGNQFLAS